MACKTHRECPYPMRLDVQTLAAIALITIGIGASGDPRKASVQYGLKARDGLTLGYVRACGVRDIALGTLLLLSSKRGRWPLIVTGFVGLADALTVSATAEAPTARSLAPHVGGALAAFGAALFIRRADE